MSEVVLGLNSFGDVTVDTLGNRLSMDRVLQNVIEQGILADEVGVDFIGLGEHHRDDFSISSPEVLLGALASSTKNIRLGTAVTVLSTDDPVRLYQRFSTLNAISNCRAEVILGRGAFIESYPLFGYDLNDFDLLFEERVDLFAQLLKNKPITWSGKTRPSINDLNVYPPMGDGFQTWIGVGGTLASVARVVKYDFQLMLAIIGGPVERFKSFVDYYHSLCKQMNKIPKPIGVHVPGFIAKTDEEAKERFWNHYKTMMHRLARERGWSPISKEQFNYEVEVGALFVGSPDSVARKIARSIKNLNLGRFDIKYTTGGVPHEYQMECIKLYGQEVIPKVRELLNDKSFKNSAI